MNRLPSLMKLHAADPADADVLYMIAQEHAKSGDHREAITWYTKCLTANPDYHYAGFHMARSLQSVGDIAAAMGVLSTSLGRARAQGDQKAAGELAGYLDELT